MNSFNAVSNATRQQFTGFKAAGKLDLAGAERKDLTSAQATDLYTQFKDQMDQTIGFDNIPQADKNPAAGEVDSTVLGEGVTLKASFDGSTASSGTVAMSIEAPGASSQAIAEFADGTLTIIQIADLGEGKSGTIAAVLNPSGQSFIEAHNAPLDGLIAG